MSHDQPPGASPPPQAPGSLLERTRFLVAATVTAWIVICATGVWLMAQDQAVGSASYSDMEIIPALDWGLWVRRIHLLAMVVVVLLGIVGAQRAIRATRRGLLAALFASLAVLSVTAAVLAWLIPWDQLAFLGFFGDRSSSTVFGDNRFSDATYRTLRTVHQLLLSILGTTMLVVLTAEALRHAATESAGDSDADIVE